MAKITEKRRIFLRALIFWGAAAVFATRFLRPKVKERRPLLQVLQSDIPQHGALVYETQRVAVIRSGEEIYALSLICTHLGCTVGLTPEAFICPCHGSVFDRAGQVKKGPADKPLARLEVKLQGEDVLVYA